MFAHYSFCTMGCKTLMPKKKNSTNKKLLKNKKKEAESISRLLNLYFLIIKPNLHSKFNTMKGTKVCSAKPGKSVHTNVHTKTAHQQLMGKLMALGMDVKTYMVEVQIRREMRMLNLNLNQ